MADPNWLNDRLDIAASSLGLIGSFILMYTGWRLAPAQEILDEVSKLDPAGLGGDLLIAVSQKGLRDIKKIRRWERPLMVIGAAFLVASFGCSIARHFL